MFKKIWPYGLVLVFLLLLGNFLINFYVNLLWFRELGLEELMLKPFAYELLRNVVYFPGSLLAIWISLNFIRAGIVRRFPGLAQRTAKIKRMILAIAALIFAFSAFSYPWETDDSLVILRFLNRASFGISDPLFGRDIGYYIFTLPVIETVFGIILSFAIFAAIASIIYSIAVFFPLLKNYSKEKLSKPQTPSKRLSTMIAVAIVAIIMGISILSWYAAIILILISFTVVWALFKGKTGKSIDSEGDQDILVSESQRKSALSFFRSYAVTFIALIFIILAFRVYFLKIPSVLFSTHDVVATGANNADITIWLPYLKGLSIVFILVAGALLLSLRRNYKLLIGGAIAVLVLYVTAGNAAYSLYSNFVVKPNEFEKESPFLDSHIKASRAAWNLDTVEEKSFSGEATLTKEDVKKNKTAFNNARLWNREQLLEIFKQTQGLRTYYDFFEVDDDRYMINGEYRQIMLAARELKNDAISPGFINQNIIYTHGYGVVAVPTAEVTPTGLPVFIAKDIPTQGDLKIQSPRIYFGEQENNYTLLNAKTEELDYPSGEANAYTKYDGRAGIPLDTIWKRLIFGWKFGFDLFFTDQVTSQTTIAFDRSPSTRVNKLFGSFLTPDPDFYIVIDNGGKLHWMGDGYTLSSAYPYARMFNLSLGLENRTGEQDENSGMDVNYMRNSVKFVIDPHTGKVTAYVSDANDPLIKTYQKIFPGVFKSLSELSPDLKAHLRYPSDYFAAQALAYTSYHVKDPRIFYNGEDNWQIPVESDEYLMRHFIAKLPGEDKEEFIFMIPFTPLGKSNLVNWLAVRNDGDNYSKIVSYFLPKQNLIYGPDQIRARINQDPAISQQITLWDRNGSRVVRGSLFVVPIENSFVYVQPLYLYATQEQSIPELRGVIMAYGDKIAMGTNVSEALNKLFGTPVSVGSSPQQNTSTPPNTDKDVDSLIKEADQVFQEAEQARREGKWDVYGEKNRKLKELLDELVKETK